MTANVSVAKEAGRALAGSALILFVSEADVADGGHLGPEFEALIAGLRRSGELSGRGGEVVVAHTFGHSAFDRLVLAGIGRDAGDDLETFRWAAGTAVRSLRAKGAESAVLDVPPAASSAAMRDRAQSVVEGALLANYAFTAYRSGPQRHRPLREFVIASSSMPAAVAEGVRRGVAGAGAVSLARDLCNQPGNMMRPADFAAAIENVAAVRGMAFTALDEANMAEAGMGAILTVGQGSHNRPVLARLDYRPAGARNAGRPVVLVGKSVTFDSGGISLKPALDMERMKADMGGGAAVLGAMDAAALLTLPIEITGLFPIVENMPGGGAIRPGDVIKTYAGKSVEVLNTDAEGRLILADALALARGLNPDCIIDLATLTGASLIVFGPIGIGLFGKDPGLRDALLAADRTAGERLWPMPLWPEYRDLLRSHVADLRNISTTIQQGSMMTAATFLAEFAGDARWAHLDILNTTWNEADHPYLPKGPTGSGTRTIVQYLIEKAGI